MSSRPMYNKEASSPASAKDERKLILSVDDQLNQLHARYKLLSAAGYAVLSASDGAEASSPSPAWLPGGPSLVVLPPSSPSIPAPAAALETAPPVLPTRCAALDNRRR